MDLLLTGKGGMWTMSGACATFTYRLFPGCSEWKSPRITWRSDESVQTWTKRIPNILQFFPQLQPMTIFQNYRLSKMTWFDSDKTDKCPEGRHSDFKTGKIKICLNLKSWIKAKLWKAETKLSAWKVRNQQQDKHCKH